MPPAVPVPRPSRMWSRAVKLAEGRPGNAYTPVRSPAPPLHLDAHSRRYHPPPLPLSRNALTNSMSMLGAGVCGSLSIAARVRSVDGLSGNGARYGTSPEHSDDHLEGGGRTGRGRRGRRNRVSETPGFTERWVLPPRIEAVFAELRRNMSGGT